MDAPQPPASLRRLSDAELALELTYRVGEVFGRQTARSPDELIASVAYVREATDEAARRLLRLGAA